MTTLVEYYQQCEMHLKNELNKANTPDQVVEIIQYEINKLADTNGEYIRELNSPQMRHLAQKYLKYLSQDVHLLATLRLEDSILDSEPNHSTQPNSHQSYPIITAIVGGGGTGLILGSIVKELLIKNQEQTSSFLNTFSGKLKVICPPAYGEVKNKFPDVSKKISSICTEFDYLRINLDSSYLISPLLNPFLMGLIFALFATIIAIFFIRAKNDKIKTSYQTSNLEVRNKKIIFKGVDRILNYLLQKFTNIDNVIAKEFAQAELKPLVSQLEDHSDLLEYLQNLLGVASREQAEIPTSTNKRIDEIRDFLDFKGINVEYYQHDISDPSKFQFLPSGSSEVKEYITLKPAFIKNEQVLLRGRVVKP